MDKFLYIFLEAREIRLLRWSLIRPHLIFAITGLLRPLAIQRQRLVPTRRTAQVGILALDYSSLEFVVRLSDETE